MSSTLNIHIFGAGAWAEEAVELLRDGDIYGNKINILALRDNDKKKQGKYFCNLPILSMDPIDDPLPENVKLLSIITHINGIKEATAKFPKESQWYAYIHPTTLIRNRTIISNGIFIAPRCSILSGVILGYYCRLSYDVLVSENVIVGNYCVIQPRVFIGGETVIEDCVYVGASAIIKDKIRIGHDSIIGIGSVVAKDVPPNVMVVGNPARIINKFK